MTKFADNQKVTLLISCIAVALGFFMLELYIPLLPNLFQVNQSFSIKFITSYLLGFGLTQVVAGYLLCSISAKKMLGISSFLCFVVNIWMLTHLDIRLILAARFLCGACASVLFVTAFGNVHMYFEKQKRAHGYTALFFSINVATMASFLLSIPLERYSNEMLIPMLLAVVMLALFCAVYWWHPKSITQVSANIKNHTLNLTKKRIIKQKFLFGVESGHNTLNH